MLLPGSRKLKKLSFLYDRGAEELKIFNLLRRSRQKEPSGHKKTIPMHQKRKTVAHLINELSRPLRETLRTPSRTPQDMPTTMRELTHTAAGIHVERRAH